MLLHKTANDDGRDILVDLLASVSSRHAARAAASLLDEFGTLARILGAGPSAHARVVGDQPEVVNCLALVRQAMLHALATEVAATPLLENTEAVSNYLHVAMAYEPREQVRVLFLNSRHHLIRDEVMSSGTVTSTTIHPREIIRRALELGATGLILAHNHPHGHPQPSREDIIVTRSIVEAAKALQLSVHDHLVIGRHGFASMRSLGLM